MKKLMTIFALCVCVGVVSGCGSKSKTIECTLSQKDASYELKSTYKIFANNGVVDKVEMIDAAISDSKTILDTLESTLNKQYSNQQKLYGGYTFDVKNDGSKVESKVTIDYTKVDMDQLTSDNTSLKKYVNKKNRITVDGIVSIYEAVGAVCQK